MPETTVVLGDQERSALLEVRDDGTLLFAADAAPALDDESVVVSEPTAAAPNGLLRKVTGVSEQGGQVVVETRQAKLEEAVYQGEAHAEFTLSPADVASATPLAAGVTLGQAGARRPAGDEAERVRGAAGAAGDAAEAAEAPPPHDGAVEAPAGAAEAPAPAADARFEVGFDDVVVFDLDGDEATKDDQVRVSGEVGFEASFDLDIDLDYDFPFDVDLEFSVRAGLEQSAELEVEGDLEGELAGEVEVARYDFDPIVIYLGPVPLVFTPRLTLLLSASGELSAHVTYQATEEAVAAVGVAYDEDEGFEDLSDLSLDFGGEGADFEARALVKGKASIKFDLFLYGLVGPYGRLDAYLELDGKVPRSPTWLLYGGVDGWIGIDSVDVLDISYDKKVLEYREEIARAGNGPPTVEITAGGGEKQLDVPVTFSARLVDREDGNDCCAATWTSDVDGQLGTTSGSFPRLDHTFTTPGTRTVTVRAVDADGAIAKDTVAVTVVNTPPTLGIDKPTAGEEVYAGLPYVVRGTSHDPNEPDQSLACEALHWSSSLITDDVPAAGCEITATFDPPGTRTLTLSATDSHGAASTTSVSFVVVEPPAVTPPAVRIVSPRNRAVIDPAEEVLLEAEATDPEGEALTYEWSLTYQTTSGPETVPVGTGNGITWVPEETLDLGFCEVSLYAQLDAAVTNESGATGRDYVQVWILRIC